MLTALSACVIGLAARQPVPELERSVKKLFLCTANGCRSILSEAVFNHRASAGPRSTEYLSMDYGLLALSLDRLDANALKDESARIGALTRENT